MHPLNPSWASKSRLICFPHRTCSSNGISCSPAVCTEPCPLSPPPPSPPHTQHLRQQHDQLHPVLTALCTEPRHPPPPLPPTHIQHQRQQHEQLQPVFTALCQAYPTFIQPHMFTWEAFLWAAELWWVGEKCVPEEGRAPVALFMVTWGAFLWAAELWWVCLAALCPL